MVDEGAVLVQVEGAITRVHHPRRGAHLVNHTGHTVLLTRLDSALVVSTAPLGKVWRTF